MLNTYFFDQDLFKSYIFAGIDALSCNVSIFAHMCVMQDTHRILRKTINKKWLM